MLIVAFFEMRKESNGKKRTLNRRGLRLIRRRGFHCGILFLFIEFYPSFTYCVPMEPTVGLLIAILARTARRENPFPLLFFCFNAGSQLIQQIMS